MAKTRQAVKYPEVLKQLKEGFKNTDAHNVIQLLEQQAKDAVVEVLSGYLASPDALRELVKEEFARVVQYDYVGQGYKSALENMEISAATLQKAKELAEEHMQTPEFEAQQVEYAKNMYLAAYKEKMERYIKDHAWRDAHEAYQRAFRSSSYTRRTRHGR